jgi:hypothetical protein
VWGTRDAQAGGMPARDRPLAFLCLVAFTICAAMFVGTQAYWLQWWGHWSYLPVPLNAIPGLMHAVGAGATVWLSSANARGQVSARSVSICVAGLVVAMLGSHHFFGSVVHDFWSPAHQQTRWCPAVDSDYLVRSDTAPHLLFGPVILPLALRGWWLVRRRKARAVDRNLERLPT